MEDNQHAAMGVGGMEVTTTEVFTIPEHEKKDFYLKMAYLLRPMTCTPNLTEHELLCILYKELKTILTAVTRLNMQPWALPFVEIQKVTGYYLMNADASKKELAKMNESVSEYMKCLAMMDANMAQIKRLVAVYSRYYKDVAYLIKHDE